MSVVIEMEEDNQTHKTSERRDEIDLEYCIRRVLNSGYTIEAARSSASDRFSQLDTPTREYTLRHRDLSPPVLSPYSLRAANEGDPAHTADRRRSHVSFLSGCNTLPTSERHQSHISFRPGYDTTPVTERRQRSIFDTPLVPDRRHSRVSFSGSVNTPTTDIGSRVSFLPSDNATPMSTKPFRLGDQYDSSRPEFEGIAHSFPSCLSAPVTTSTDTRTTPTVLPQYSSSISLPPHRLPKLPQFSGELKKEDVEFVVWKYEVNCLLKSGIYSEYCILESIRSSLKGKARSVLLHLGERATVPEIIKEMDATYGNVATTEKLKEQFYSASQRENESIVDYSLRLEHLLCDSQIPLDRRTRDDMLRNRMWSGLRNQDLKNATRYKFETELDYTKLRRELRLVEEDMKASQSTKAGDKPPQSNIKSDKSADARQCSSSVESRLLQELQELTSQMKSLNSRVGRKEKDLEEVKKNRSRPEGPPRWRNRGTDNRNQGNQGTDKKQPPPPQSDTRSSSDQQKPLNSQVPPPKGQ